MRFRVRFTVGSSLLGLLVALLDLAAEVAAGDRMGMALTGGLAGCIALQLGAIRIGLSVGESQAEQARLRPMVSVCAWCKRIRREEGWVSPEHDLAEHRHHDVTHAICPTCFEALFPDAK